MQPTGLTGGGVMTLDKAKVTADLFTYNANWFGSETADLPFCSRSLVFLGKHRIHDFQLKVFKFDAQGNTRPRNAPKHSCT